MDHNYVLGIMLKPIIHLSDQRKQEVERWSMVIEPVEIGHSVLKVGLVVLALAHVEQPILLGVMFIQKLADLCAFHVKSSVKTNSNLRPYGRFGRASPFQRLESS